jgi:hypothetical protein
MNAIAAFQMVKAIDEERRHYVERRRRRAESAESDARYRGGQSWRAILRFPRLTPASSKG